MNIIELDKKFCKEDYNGNYEEMIKAKDGVIFTDEVVKSAFNFGNGTEKDLKKHIENNRCFCKYYDLDKKQFI